MNKVVVISPHPDDETLGCGGTILKHKNEGDSVYCIFITNIDVEHGFSKEKVLQRQKEIEIVSSKYNFDKIFKLNFTPATLTPNDLPNLINSISKIFKSIEPNIVYIPNKTDVHSDHRIIFDAVFPCTKSFRYPYIKKVLMYETISETEFSSESAFSPNYFVNITHFIEQKIDIMKTYSSELQNGGKSRTIENIKALALFRGATANCEYAESFVILKKICD